MILFDANILVHAHAATSPWHGIAQRLRDQAAQGELEACLSPQVLCEFFSVITDDRVVRPVLTSTQARHEVERYWCGSRFRKIVPREHTIDRLVKLLERHPEKRRGIFDAFLVATMLDNGVQTIYTLNVRDFEAYPELRVINPLGDPAPLT